MMPDDVTPKVDKPIAQHKIRNQIAKGNAILELIIETEAQYDMAKQSNNNWMKNTKCLLLELINEVAVSSDFPLFLWNEPYNQENFYESINDFREAINKTNEYLEMILDKLDQTV